VTLPARYLDAGHVVHGYALTGHKTQGLTVERTFVLADDQRALKEWGYVALSRARCETRLYAIENQLEPDASPHRIEPAAPVDRLAEALSRPAAETLAVDAARRGRPLPERVRLVNEHRQLLERHATLDKERWDAAHELHQTQRRLDELGALGRARHGRALRLRIEEQRRTVKRLVRARERIEEQQRLNRKRMRELVPREPKPERGLGREPSLERGRSPERSLDRGIEL
jgi:UvrD-like helicase C-terminal domain